MRTALGVIAIVEGQACWPANADANWPMLGAGILAMFGGAVLVAGLFTPVAGGMVALAMTVLGMGPAPPAAHLLDDRLGVGFVACVAVAVVLLGPGAFSFDSYLFGRREIIIPPDGRSDRSI